MKSTRWPIEYVEAVVPSTPLVTVHVAGVNELKVTAVTMQISVPKRIRKFPCFGKLRPLVTVKVVCPVVVTAAESVVEVSLQKNSLAIME
jgi:hypothetical protein